MLENDNNWLDVTTPIRNGMVHWPGDIDVQITRRSSMEQGADANVSELSTSLHIGTHVDAPLHFISNGDDVTSIDLDRLMGDVRVIRIKDNKIISFEEILENGISEGERIIFMTSNSEKEWLMQPFLTDYVYLSTEGAKYLAAKKIKTVGIDYLSIAGEENATEVHQLLLENNILIIEGLNLKGIQPGKYEMICLPVKIVGADGAPARTLLKPKN
jgi:arylformamidase